MIGNDWDKILYDEFNKSYFKKLICFIKNEYESKTIFPKKDDIFNAFRCCPFSKVKFIILGQDPYHNFNQSHGLAFSVLKGNRVPPSLKNIFKEMASDLNIEIPRSGNLKKWSRQGVLLLNTILTVRAHQPLSHQHLGWQQFTDHIISLLNDDDRPKVFVLWGNNAQKKSTLITNPNHLIISSSHPSPLSARHSFFGSRVFSRINHFLEEHNLEEIDFTL